MELTRFRAARSSKLLEAILTILVSVTVCTMLTSGQKQQKKLQPSQNITNNWAIIVSSSKYWFNYRHASNALSIYRSVKRLGIDDSHIILMLADDMACDARNPFPGTLFNDKSQRNNLYGDDIEVDYRGEDVTVENFIRMLTGRHPPGTTRSKKLLTDEGSNILIYLTGHGGDGFLKFQDKGELTATEFAEAIDQMHQKKRYNEILLIIDTCQAESMSMKLTSPNVIGLGSSKIGEDSLSYKGDSTIGVYIIDRFTYYALVFLERLNTKTANTTSLKELFQVCPEELCISNVKVRLDLYQRDPSKVPLTDFFSNKLNLHAMRIQDDPAWTNML